MARHNIHATGLVLGRTGLILRGPPGAGKSLLALELLEQWEARGEAAILVSDDRVEIEATGEVLTMHAPAAIAGLIELRGRGIISRPHVESAQLSLVVDLVDRFERMPEPGEFSTTLCDIVVARAPVPRLPLVERGHQLMLIREALRQLSPPCPARKKTA